MHKTMSFALGGFLLAAGAFADNRVLEVSAGESTAVRAAIFDVAGTHVFRVPANMIGTAQVLVVGGGGAGGGVSGGGGGGGQVVFSEGVALTPGAECEVTVAAGGAPDVKSGGNGGTSRFMGISAQGGGGGGGGWTAAAGLDGANGGGAGGNAGTAAAGGRATVEGGFPGADREANYWGAGGGGGAAEAGHLRSDAEKSAQGGAGVVLEITGTAVMYGYGGGSTEGRLSGAQNEWGRGDTGTETATPGEAGTGGGGGGGRRGDGSASGGAGGTGAVVIRYTVALETVEVDFTADRTTGFLPLLVQFTAAVDRPSGAPMALTWDFGDGSAPVETAEASVAHVYTRVGTFSVSVTAVANGQSRQKAVADLVNVVSPFVYVNVDSAAPAKPYATRETAAATLEEAMAAVTFPGQAIRIMPGTYPLERPVELKDAVAVEGDGATPADVVIVQSLENKWYSDVADRRRNLFTLDHPKARVSNLTMKNGWHRMVDQGHSAGGVVIGESGGVVSNCIITGCVNSRANHGAAGADLAAGLITHTLVENCEIDTPQTASTAASGGAAALRLTGCARAENCLVRNCNKGGETGQFHAVLVDGEEARAVNLTIVSCGSVPYAYQNSGDATAPSYGLCVTRGLAVNCAVADVRERDGAAANRAWGGVAENFVNCATDTDARINDTSVTVTAADFRAFAAGDCRPKAGGALVNAGSDIAGFSPGSVDFAGNPRVQGRSIDIGCIEGVPCGMLIIIQ